MAPHLVSYSRNRVLVTTVVAATVLLNVDSLIARVLD